MRSRWESLRGALVLAASMPDDRALQIALALADSSAYAAMPNGRAPQGDHDPEATRLRALVDLAKQGDADAFGQLYDHYVTGVFRFIYYRVGSRQLAEDLTSETFLRGLRAIQRFNWQGKDFGAWLTTIARNLVADHFKSSRSRLEIVSENIPERGNHAPSTEQEVLAHISNELLYQAVSALPTEQRDCILMRFIQGLSIAQTAAALDRSEGAVKQLQLRAVRSLAKSIPVDSR
ncbi:sigma-70 family RNA polymerase sigma factor [Aeromicrobium wangtongii]|uniref:Sigma-70 family RNA polymerase sigma factor n=1 Tax=Aeromicrobium wangtongii TaxID=2969247 RepID=A0ABY5M575_9ACTN|nr:sigma-70 family RNA polymerase sigma factor [Aeromicrobium wangtongii]MCD9200068.1 sigma-70 family RNA polymerase sigma factor [Aeromicrobium wangtongii]UUP13325.1 sigma-70 family RNA polymerase sigma factor [Aeromicrobium wangtongii]